MVAAARCPLHGTGPGRLPLALPTRGPSRRGLERPWAPPSLESGCAVGSGLDSGLESAPGDQMSARLNPGIPWHHLQEVDSAGGRGVAQVPCAEDCLLGPSVHCPGFEGS